MEWYWQKLWIKRLRPKIHLIMLFFFRPDHLCSGTLLSVIIIESLRVLIATWRLLDKTLWTITEVLPIVQQNSSWHVQNAPEVLNPRKSCWSTCGRIVQISTNAQRARNSSRPRVPCQTILVLIVDMRSPVH